MKWASPFRRRPRGRHLLRELSLQHHALGAPRSEMSTSEVLAKTEWIFLPSRLSKHPQRYVVSNEMCPSSRLIGGRCLKLHLVWRETDPSIQRPTSPSYCLSLSERGPGRVASRGGKQHEEENPIREKCVCRPQKQKTAGFSSDGLAQAPSKRAPCMCHEPTRESRPSSCVARTTSRPRFSPPAGLSTTTCMMQTTNEHKTKRLWTSWLEAALRCCCREPQRRIFPALPVQLSQVID